MKKNPQLPHLPFEVCEIIFEYAFGYNTYSEGRRYFLKNRYGCYGYGHLNSLETYLYKEIYDLPK